MVDEVKTKEYAEEVHNYLQKASIQQMFKESEASDTTHKEP